MGKGENAVERRYGAVKGNRNPRRMGMLPGVLWRMPGQESKDKKKPPGR